jgi:hypothetical protein
MSSDTKITLSAYELQLVSNSDWILTKRSIMDKTVKMFSHIAETVKDRILDREGILPEEIRLATPKITKGENYLGLPYVILDYPARFGKTDIFAIRSMFWWGNFYSCTLHLAGKYRQLYEANIMKHIKTAEQFGCYLCINEDPWQHHFEQENYQAISALQISAINEIMGQQNFMKLAVKFPLQHVNEMPSILAQHILKMTDLLQD